MSLQCSFFPCLWSSLTISFKEKNWAELNPFRKLLLSVCSFSNVPVIAGHILVSMFWWLSWIHVDIILTFFLGVLGQWSGQFCHSLCSYGSEHGNRTIFQTRFWGKWVHGKSDTFLKPGNAWIYLRLIHEYLVLWNNNPSLSWSSLWSLMLMSRRQMILQ